ncbi:hypothetical protein GPJ81_16405 [Pseudomonas alkylphenolica]|jgi:hypothetical protein|uniref:Uncharacterized protein n=1 Tax=Pseudomonas alkylphenolica TaxID=237609 RepID=A0A6I6GUL7_9PSED|nr:hypothetical protein [Pseudomonas alkylphenolica]QGW78202.1 hypothetical protein GPJ81_16405 [Pseudomonas alkylphenolica]
MSNRVLMVVFGLAITTASTISGYCAYETSQLVRKAYYMDSEAAELAPEAEFSADGAEGHA